MSTRALTLFALVGFGAALYFTPAAVGLLVGHIALSLVSEALFGLLPRRRRRGIEFRRPGWFRGSKPTLF